MDDKQKAAIFRDLQQASSVYAAALMAAGAQLDSTALLNRCDDVIAEGQVYKADAEHYERNTRKPGKVLPFRRPAPRVQAAVEEAEWLGGLP